MEFKRKVYNKMIKWKNEYAPDYALFLKGARRVGKSTLALRLGREEYKSYIEIRFDKAPDEIKELFINSLEDLDYFIRRKRNERKKEKNTVNIHTQKKCVLLADSSVYKSRHLIGETLQR